MPLLFREKQLEVKVLLLFPFYRFNVNRRICIVGFGLYGSIHGPTDYQVNIQVMFSIKGRKDTCIASRGVRQKIINQYYL